MAQRRQGRSRITSTAILWTLAIGAVLAVWFGAIVAMWPHPGGGR